MSVVGVGGFGARWGGRVKLNGGDEERGVRRGRMGSIVGIPWFGSVVGAERGVRRGHTRPMMVGLVCGVDVNGDLGCV